jgi:uncharacterized protein YaiE (UPF0345 family)
MTAEAWGPSDELSVGELLEANLAEVTGGSLKCLCSHRKDWHRKVDGACIRACGCSAFRSKATKGYLA